MEQSQSGSFPGEGGGKAVRYCAPHTRSPNISLRANHPPLRVEEGGCFIEPMKGGPAHAGAACLPNQHMHHPTSRGRFRSGAITVALLAVTHLTCAQTPPATTGLTPV